MEAEGGRWPPPIGEGPPQGPGAPRQRMWEVTLVEGAARKHYHREAAFVELGDFLGRFSDG